MGTVHRPQDEDSRSSGADVSRETGDDRWAEYTRQAKRVLDRILEELAPGCRVDESPSADPETICLTVSGEEAGRVIGHHGHTLDALEHLLNRIVFREERRASGRLALDAEGYRARRQDQLSRQALRVASRVRETGRPVAMEPMTARERRLVHIALRDYAGVSTASEGEGEERHVVVSPSRWPSRGRQRPIL